MGKPPIVTRIESTQFSFDVPDVSVHPVGGQLTYTPGKSVSRTARVVQVFTDQGIVGEYLGGSESEHVNISQFASLAHRPQLVGPRSLLQPGKAHPEAVGPHGVEPG